MEAKELRIGNYILSGENNVFSILRVEYFDNDFVFFIGENTGDLLSECKPTPLTEGWLDKLPNDLVYPEWIEFVHDLQNWYYYKNQKKELKLK